MAGKFFILQNVSDFAPGYFENTVVEAGCVQLARRGRAYHEEGCYTTVPFQSEGFFSMIPSWNADTPPGTSVQMEARVSTGGQWSQWFNFGRWGSHLKRASAPPQKDDIAETHGETLSLADGCPAADGVQLRVWLYAQGGSRSPRIRLLAASTNATQQMGAEAPAFERELEVPTYACLNRDPAIATHMASATTLAMMMNRFGRDLLPEEVARCAYDWRAVSYDNLNYLCATTAAYGFSCHMGYAGLPALRREVWQGRAVAARVHYRAPQVDGTEDAPEQARFLPPVLEGAASDTSGHLVAVRGFITKNGADYVVVNDPLAETDQLVRREIPVQLFAQIYTGLSLFVERGRFAARLRPQRHFARLQLRDGCLYMFTDGWDELVPARLADETLTPATLCYTHSDGVAYASAAQQRFYYTAPGEAGQCRFEEKFPEDRKTTVYLIGPLGDSWVAELLPKRVEDSRPWHIIQDNPMGAAAAPTKGETP